MAEGQILVDGVDIRQLRVADYWGNGLLGKIQRCQKYAGLVIDSRIQNLLSISAMADFDDLGRNLQELHRQRD